MCTLHYVLPQGGLLGKQNAQEIRQQYYFFAAALFFGQMSPQLHHYLEGSRCVDTVLGHLQKSTVNGQEMQNLACINNQKVATVFVRLKLKLQPSVALSELLRAKTVILF